MQPTHNPPNQKKGAILILLLGLLFACALMVTAFVQTALNELRFSNQQLADAALRPHAESALQVILASLNEYRATNQTIHRINEALNQACQRPSLQFPESIQIEIAIVDCAAKIGLRTLQSQSQWAALLEPLEISQFEKNNLIDATLDWIDSDEHERPYGAERSYYESIDQAQLPPNQAIRSLQEFNVIKGFEPSPKSTETDKYALFDHLFKTLSPYSISAPNLNTAGQAVLDYITGDTSESLAIIDYRNGPDGRPNTEDDRAFTSMNEVLRFGIQTKQAYILKAGPFIVRIHVTDGARSFSLTGFISGDQSNKSSLLGIEHSSEYLQF
jgi:hypothetical protein